MILQVTIDERRQRLTIPDALLTQAVDFYDQLDRDMEHGWQMSRDWVAALTSHQRCQIVADKLLTALETGNDRLGVLMAGYLLTRQPGLVAVTLDTQGDMNHHHFTLAADAEIPSSAPAMPEPRVAGMSKIAAMAQAGHEVTPVFRVGRGWRFAVFDPATHGWQDAPLTATEAEATVLRQAAFKARYEALLA